MKQLRIIYLIILTASVYVGRSQTELVPNGSFESYSICPASFSCIEYSSDTYIDNWVRPSEATSDFLHACASVASLVSVPENYFFDYQPARTGEGYGGFYVYLYGFLYREYLQVELIEPMEAGECYYVEFYTAPNEVVDGFYGALASDRLGLHIAEERITMPGFDYGPLDVIPQITNPAGSFITDTLNWTKVSGIYVAEGGEAWITIGNFYDDADTEAIEFIGEVGSGAAYYAVDDVSITPLSSLSVLEDTVICIGETLTLEGPPGADSYSWNTGATGPSISVTESGTYIITVEYPCGVFSDTAEVIVNSEGITYETYDILSCYDAFPLTIDASDLYTSYLWSTGAVTASIEVSEPGVYTVTGAAGCGLFIDSFMVEEIPAMPEPSLTDTVLICTTDGSAELEAGEGFAAYLWNTGDTGGSITVDETGLYEVEMYAACDTFVHAYTVIKDPFLGLQLSLPEQAYICAYTTPIVTLTATPGFPAYEWNTGETTASIQVTEPGVYSVGISTFCLNQEATTVVSNCEVMAVPNAFSPNGDGLNDLFFTYCSPCDGFRQLSIFNRWGELVFQTGIPETGWDGTYGGKAADVGAYTYVLEYTEAGVVQIKQGSLTLVR